ncbi:MAG: FtsX-like permease family protein [Coriobacteriaceae bacterium]|nr:FtsX-like permease family protein [Coriobacteriaceae bacterium]
MRSAFVKSSLRQIKQTLPRFLSILIITALGVAFFAGLRLTGPYMQMAGDDYLQQQNYADIKLLSTLGFDEDDVATIRQADGVEQLSASYSTNVLLERGDARYNIHLISIDEGSDALNAPLLLEGHLPRSSGECLVEPDFLKATGLELGDEVTFRSGNDKDISESLRNVSFTITGSALSPLYVGENRGTNDIGNGHIDAFFLIPAEDFNLDVYTEIYLTTQYGDESFFTAEYLAAIKPTIDSLTSVGEWRSVERYEMLMADADSELDEARQEIADGRTQLADAEIELDNARSELDDAWAQLDDSASQLATGKATLEQNRSDYYNQIASERSRLDNGYAQLASGRTQYEAGLARYQQGEAQYQQGYQLYEQGEAQYQQGYQLYEQGVAQLQAAIEQLQQQRISAFQLLDEQEAALDSEQPDYAEALAAIQAQREALAIQFDSAEGALVVQQQQLDETRLELETARAQLDETSLQLAASRTQLNEAKTSLDTSLQQLQESQQQLDAGSAQLDAAQQAAESRFASAQQEISDGQAAWEAGRDKLLDGEAEYTKGNAEFEAEREDALVEISDAEEQIASAEEDLAALEPPKWYVLDLEDNPGLFGYKSAAEQIMALATTIPILFFLIAALVSMTSMTRLVDSDRTQIGTYKALGYRSSSLFGRYLFYALSASLIGGLIGVVVGYNVIPPLIFDAYGSIYSVPSIPVPFDIPYALLSIGVAVVTATVPALLVTRHIMHEVPAETMRPAAPPAGKHSLVEGIKPLWRRLSFLHKVTLRNLFRYKKRLFMTLIGVAGCTALMFAGFGLHDSLSTVSPKQFGDILRYDLQLDYKNDASDEDRTTFYSTLGSTEEVESYTTLSQQPVEAIVNGSTRNVFLVSPDNPVDFARFIDFRTMTDGSPITLDSEGVIITAGLARSLDLEPGDSILLRNLDSDEATFSVSAVMENYIFHNVYISPELYAEGFGARPESNQVLAMLSGDNGTISDAVLGMDIVTGATYMEDNAAELGSMVGALKYVVWVLVISAAALVFVVLFSLMTINMEERNRELASIKVLGFLDRELAAYVYREAIILTVVGIILGLALGVGLERYIIATIEVDSFMFSSDLLWPSFALSAILTAVFATVVNIIMFRGITRIEMVSSLKNVE